MTVGMSAHADTPLTNETNAVVAAVQTNGTNAVAEAVDEAIVLTPKERVERRLQEFAKKKGDGFAYGDWNEKTGEIYFSNVICFEAPLTNQAFMIKRSNALVLSLNSIVRDYAQHIHTRVEERSDVPYGNTMLNTWEYKTEANVSGLAVGFVCEAVAKDGTAAVGIVAKAPSPIIYEVVRCANEGVRPNIPSQPGIPYKKIVSDTDERLAALGVGPRFYYNENGLPEVMAIGQSPVSCSEERNGQEMRREMALKRAENDANQWLSQFLAGELVGSKRDEFSVDGLHAKFISDFKITARASMRGRIVATKKIIRHATGHEIAFVVIRLPVWSFPEEKPEQKTTPAKTAEADKKYDF